MIWTTTRRVAVATATALLLLGSVTGCGLLDVSDPTAIQQSELENANGANLLRMNALTGFYSTVRSGTVKSALLTDELFAETPAIFEQYGMVNVQEFIDRRESVPYEDVGGGLYLELKQARVAATVAMPGLRSYVGLDRVGEMFAVRGYTTLMLAELVCPGFPLHQLVDNKPVYDRPRTTEEAFEDALVDFDSALALSADSARINNWARVGRARALLGLGRFTEAAQAAAPVPDLFTQNAEFTTAGGVFLPNDFGRPLYTDGYTANVSVADQEGGNGLDYVSANDPRMKTTPRFLASDGVTWLSTPDKFPSSETGIAVASGIEARLIEAEAALEAGDVTAWRDKLNAPRRSAWSTIVPAVAGPLTDLPDPGTDDARLALTFRERAFWLWGTAHRLGDLRRLVSRYGRNAESVYPTGAYRLGEAYDVATSIPFPANMETEYSPTVTGCTSR